jgi:hypothetical protein
MSSVSNAYAQEREGHTDDTAVSLIRVFAGFSGGLAILTFVWLDWIEVLTGYDPDQHNGTGRSRGRGPTGTRTDDV